MIPQQLGSQTNRWRWGKLIKEHQIQLKANEIKDCNENKFILYNIYYITYIILNKFIKSKTESNINVTKNNILLTEAQLFGY